MSPPRSKTSTVTSMGLMTTNSITHRVVQKFKEKTAMAVVLRNIADHDWGWFSREDERMHLQTVEEGARSGPKRAKVWLEDDGKRICTLDDGKVSGPDFTKLQAKVKAERKNIESRWINFMIKNGWLKAELDGSVVTLTAYPKSHNKFTRTIDLRDEFPGAYSDRVAKPWDEHPPEITLDDEHAALAVGREPTLDDREHIDLTKWVFED